MNCDKKQRDKPEKINLRHSKSGFSGQNNVAGALLRWMGGKWCGGGCGF